MSDNPYAAALDGLVLEDPVGALFDFCRAREAVRLRREAGQPPPWTDDPILQRGRFLNVFREHDRGTRAIRRFLAPVRDPERLVQAALFARWCNHPETLDRLSAERLEDPEALRQWLLLLPEQPWCNVSAYPVEPARHEGRPVSRLDTATRLLDRLREPLLRAVRGADRDVVRATRAVNALLGLRNDFPVFMAVSDLAWFMPDLVDPASPVPTGIGASPFLDLMQRQLGLDSHAATCERVIELQRELWPEAPRPFHPIDVEYLSCECRKYYSYVVGTKRFEGRNLYVPGTTACVEVDVDARPERTVHTRVRVLAGGPCAGKTTLLRALAERGHRVVPETSRRLIEEGALQGLGPEELRADPLAWQRAVMLADVEQMLSLPVDQPVWLDTSVVEDLVYAERAGLRVGPGIRSVLRHVRFERVFFLDSLPDYDPELRLESPALARRLAEQVLERYRRHGYEPARVPVEPVERRLERVLRA